MKRYVVLFFIYISVTSCADLINLYYIKNPDDRGFFYYLNEWIQNPIYGFIVFLILPIPFVIIFYVLNWFISLFKKK